MARLHPVPVRRGALIAAIVVACLGLGQTARAQDAGGTGSDGLPDYPIPATAQQAYSPIGEGFESPLDPRENLKGPLPYVDGRAPLLRSVSRGLQDEGPFLRDTKLRLNSRTYWLTQDVFGFESEALTTGGSLAYQSGYIADFLQLRGVLYTSQPLCAGRCRSHVQPHSRRRSDHHARPGERAAEIRRAGADGRAAARAHGLYQPQRFPHDPAYLRRHRAVARG